MTPAVEGGQGQRIVLYRDLSTGRLIRYREAETGEAWNCNSGLDRNDQPDVSPLSLMNHEDSEAVKVRPGLVLADELLFGFNRPIDQDDSEKHSFLAKMDKVLAELSRTDREGKDPLEEAAGVSSVWRTGLSQDQTIISIRFAETDRESMLDASERVARTVVSALREKELFELGESGLPSEDPAETDALVLQFVEPHYLIATPDALAPHAFSDASQTERFSSLDDSGTLLDPSRIVKENIEVPWGLVAAKVTRSWASLKSYGDPSIEIALLDTGMYSCHEELTESLPSCASSSRTDGDPLPLALSDANGHGTRCAGVIAAMPPERSILPTAGVSPGAKILPIQVLRASNFGDLMDAVNTLQLLSQRNDTKMVLVVNASWGTSSRSQSLRRAVYSVVMSGALLVAGAGNFGDDLERCPFYPASFATESEFKSKVISVAAAKIDKRPGPGDFLRAGNECNRTNPKDCTGSNYGDGGTITLWAPGYEIKSLGISSSRSLADDAGTSMAAAFITGAIALIKTGYPQADADELVTRLKNGACHSKALEDFSKGGRFIDLEGALAKGSSERPSRHTCSSPGLCDSFCEISQMEFLAGQDRGQAWSLD